MNDKHDELLNDLISYYNSDDEISGDTTIIPAINTDPEPREELLGDTLIMTPPQPAPEVTEETTVIDIPDAPGPEIPQDEIFGNLDVNGNVIPRREREIPRRRIETPQTPQAGRHIHVAPVRKTGLWHSLKPFWATVIVSVMLVLSFLFYVTDTGIIGIYKSNFSYNLLLFNYKFISNFC